MARRLLGPDLDWALTTIRGMLRSRARPSVGQGVLVGGVSNGAGGLP